MRRLSSIQPGQKSASWIFSVHLDNQLSHSFSIHHPWEKFCSSSNQEHKWLVFHFIRNFNSNLIMTDSCRTSSYVRSNGSSQRSDPTASLDMHQPIQLCTPIFYTHPCTSLHAAASPLHSIPSSSRIRSQGIVKLIPKFQPLLTTFSLAHEQVSCTQQFLISPEVMRQLQRYVNCVWSSYSEQAFTSLDASDLRAFRNFEFNSSVLARNASMLWLAVSTGRRRTEGQRAECHSQSGPARTTKSA